MHQQARRAQRGLPSGRFAHLGQVGRLERLEAEGQVLGLAVNVTQHLLQLLGSLQLVAALLCLGLHGDPAALACSLA
jgi:hypothetical protein